MNALIVIGLCALSANAQFIQGVLPFSPYTNNLLHSAAFTPASYPITYGAAVAPATSLTQFHAQDEFGQFNFGYHGGPSSRNEVRDAFGVVRGQYNLIDANGKVQQTNYVADALGFRVAASDLPVAPVAVADPVKETAEVAAARATLYKLQDEAKAAAAAPVEETSAPARKKREADVGSVAVHAAFAPALAYGHAIAPTVTYAANPAVAYAAAPHAVAPPAIAPGVAYAAGHAIAPHMTYAAGHAFAPHTTYAVGSHAFAPGAVTYAAAGQAVSRDATLMRIENNPGHAVSYRVY